MADMAAYKKMLAEQAEKGQLGPFLSSMKARIDSGRELSPKMIAALDRIIESGPQQTKIQADPTFRTKLRIRFLVLGKMKLGYAQEFVASLYRQFETKGDLSNRQVTAMNKTIKKFRNQLDDLRSTNQISRDEISEMFDAIAELPIDKFDMEHKNMIEIITDGWDSEWMPGPWTDKAEDLFRRMALQRITSKTSWTKKAQEKYEMTDNTVRPFRSDLEMHCREIVKSGKVFNWFYYARASDEKGSDAVIFFYKSEEP